MTFSDLPKNTGLVKMEVNVKVWFLGVRRTLTAAHTASHAHLQPAEPPSSLILPRCLAFTSIPLQHPPSCGHDATLSCPQAAPPLESGTLAFFVHILGCLALSFLLPHQSSSLTSLSHPRPLFPAHLPGLSAPPASSPSLTCLRSVVAISLMLSSTPPFPHTQSTQGPGLANPPHSGLHPTPHSHAGVSFLMHWEKTPNYRFQPQLGARGPLSRKPGPQALHGPLACRRPSHRYTTTGGSSRPTEEGALTGKSPPSRCAPAPHSHRAGARRQRD